MPRRIPLVLTVGFFSILVLLNICSAQTGSDKAFSRLGIGVKISTLGPGIEAATPVTANSNLRGGFNMFSYDHNFTEDGITYDGQLRLRSAEAHYDWFPFHGSFHVSPGVLVYNGNQVTANASVPGGSTFTLDSTTYTSSPTDPITGTGKVDFVKAGPMFTVGWGNLLPRNHRHFSFPVELGVVYTGAPRTALTMAGTACDSSGLNCLEVTDNPQFQANVVAQQNKFNKDIAPFRFYPLISAGFAVNF